MEMQFIEEKNKSLIEKMQKHLDNLTKPKGSLGFLEDIAKKVALIQKKVPPSINKKSAFVFAGDTKIVEENVSLYPQEVTYQMVLNFLNNGAAASVMSEFYNYDLFVVDCGVAKQFDEKILNNKNFINMKIDYGAKNFLNEPAMNVSFLDKALKNGRTIAKNIIDNKYDLVAIGDMGIGNTTTSAALLILAGFKPDEIIDRGTGINDEMLVHKKEVILKVYNKYKNFVKNPYDILMYAGSFEFATMIGMLLELASNRIVCVLDGFPVTAAAYIAYLIDKNVINILFAGHKSKVKGHLPVLNKMGLKPIVDFNMRLGEGTGAIIAGSIIELSTKITEKMASFDSANVSKSEKNEKDY